MEKIGKGINPCVNVEHFLQIEWGRNTYLSIYLPNLLCTLVLVPFLRY